MSKIRVAGFVVNLVPYQHARWNAFARLEQVYVCLIQITSRDEFRVLENTQDTPPLYDSQVLFPDTPFGEIPSNAMRQAIWETLDKFQPHVVCLNGYWAADSWSALSWCQKNGTPTVLFSESNAFDQSRKPWKEALKTHLISGFSAGLTGSSSQADYLATMGLDRSSIHTGYDAVDNEFFQQAADRVRADTKSNRQLPKNYFLACARFEEKKNLAGLVEAYALYREMNEQMNCWHLVLAGDGALRAAVEQLVFDLRLNHFVHLVGAQPIKTLPVYYAHARAFIHASTTEQWGLVVNEAMASGLPVLVSNRCGCAAELVMEGVNGFTFDPRNPEGIATAMSRISHGDSDLASMGLVSREIISKWGPDHFAQGLFAAIANAAERGPLPPNFIQKVLLKLLLLK